MIGHVVTDLIETSRARIGRLAPASITDIREQPRPLIGFSDEVLEQHGGLKQFLRHNLYRHDQVRQMNLETQEMVGVLFERYMEDPRRMPEEFAERARAGEDHQARAVADYIAGMTDRFAIAEHERLR